MLDGAFYLWNKYPKTRLLLETGASDLEREACVYQFTDILMHKNRFEEGKYHLQNCMNDKKRIIQWIGPELRAFRSSS